MVVVKPRKGRVCRIRKAVLDDLDVIVKLHELIYLDYLWFKWHTHECIEPCIEENRCFVAETGEEISGSIILRIYANVIWIETLVVRQTMQKLGVGRELLRFAEKYCQLRSKLKLMVGSFCEYGVDGFYRKCGFTMLEEIGMYEDLPYYQFEKKINLKGIKK